MDSMRHYLLPLLAILSSEIKDLFLLLEKKKIKRDKQVEQEARKRTTGKAHETKSSATFLDHPVISAP